MYRDYSNVQPVRECVAARQWVRMLRRRALARKERGTAPSTDANDHAVRHVKEHPSDDELHGRSLAFVLSVFLFADATQWHICRPLFVCKLMEIAHRL
jgi:hypothetical protein